jgi:hypothetical protein
MCGGPSVALQQRGLGVAGIAVLTAGVPVVAAGDPTAPRCQGGLRNYSVIFDAIDDLSGQAGLLGHPDIVLTVSQRAANAHYRGTAILRCKRSRP